MKPAHQLQTMEEGEKKMNVPLDEALTLAGTGIYTHYVMLVTGLTVFSAILGMQVMSIVIPAAGCDFDLTVHQKGILTSMAFAGMVFSSHLFGILADTLGRKKVMFVCNIMSVIVTVISSLSPNALTLMVMTFINGFVLGGVFTPAYVYVSEFSPIHVRTRGLLICSALSALGTVYLPCVARLIMPLDIHVPLFGGIVFTSWRLYLALLALPNLIANVLLLKLPETPKFLLNVGKEEETLEILRKIYSVNMRAPKDKYQVQHVILDQSDHVLTEKSSDESSSKCIRYVKIMIKQTFALFTPPFIIHTIFACVIMLIIVGVYNTVILWIPEQTRQLMIHSDTHSIYNVTLCDVMESNFVTEENATCEINYDIFFTSIIIAILQFVLFIIVSLFSHKINGKIFIVIFTAITTGASLLLIFARSFLLTVSSLGIIVMLLLTTFPLCLSIVINNFPTSLRSTATSITMLFGRIGAAVGTQVLGVLFQSYCRPAYWSMTSVLFGVVILCIFMPTKRA